MPTHYALPYSTRPVPARISPELWKAFAAWADEQDKEQAKIKFRRYQEVKTQYQKVQSPNNQSSYSLK